MSMLNEPDWETGMDYDPCVHHDHCAMCGVCETEVELAQEKWVPRMTIAWEDLGYEMSIEAYSLHECIPCRVKGLAEDCNAVG